MLGVGFKYEKKKSLPVHHQTESERERESESLLYYTLTVGLTGTSNA